MHGASSLETTMSVTLSAVRADRLEAPRFMTKERMRLLPAHAVICGAGNNRHPRVTRQ